MLLFSAVGAIFWYNELVYHLPTPVPANYKAINTGTFVKVNVALANNGSKPLFLHFFNPACPCSRFNMANFKSMVKQYNNRAISVLHNYSVLFDT